MLLGDPTTGTLGCVIGSFGTCPPIRECMSLPRDCVCVHMLDQAPVCMTDVFGAHIYGSALCQCVCVFVSVCTTSKALLQHTRFDAFRS